MCGLAGNFLPSLMIFLNCASKLRQLTAVDCAEILPFLRL